MKIIDWKLIHHTISPGDVVVLQKHISGRKSLFYWQTLIYMGNPRSGISQFRLKHKVNNRGQVVPRYVPKMHHIASLPLWISWPFGDTEGNTVEQAMPSIWIMGWEYFAQDSYTDVTPTDSNPDYIELDIDIPNTDFAFTKYLDFNDFIERQGILTYLQEMTWIEIFMPVAKTIVHSPTAKVWGRKATVELEQVFREPTTSYLWNWPMANYRQVNMIYKLQSGDFGNLNTQTEWNAFPLTYCRWEAPRGKFTSQDLIFDTHNTPMYDECLMSIGQLLNFIYYPTSNDDTMPTDFYIGTTHRASSEDVEYIAEWESWTIVQARTHQSRSVSPDFPRFRANLWRPVPVDDSYFISNYTLSSVEEGQAPPTRGTFQSTAEMLRHMQQVQQPQIPLEYDLQIGDIVYIHPDQIGNKFHRKNREYTVLTYYGTDSSNNQIYKIQPSSKKTFNWEWAIEMRAKHLVKAEKIAKRKFILAKDFGKYKAGETFNRDELIQIFGKFQDARDPFILNKLYICAE